MEASNGNTWNKADYWIWVATSDRTRGSFGASDVKAAFCWTVRTPSGRLVADRWSSSGPGVEDYHTRAILPAATAAMERIPEGSSAYFFSDVKFVTDLLDADPSIRIASGYTKKDKKPLAYREDWKTLDATIALRRLLIHAGRPPANAVPLSDGWKIARELENVKEAASQSARNMGLPFSDWDH